MEKHFTSTDIVRDIVIGMSDGLTVPYAMGLGGYLAARGDAEHYESERKREQREVQTVPEVEAQEVADVFQAYGLTPEESAPIVAALQRKPEAYVDFMMRFELGMEQPEPKLHSCGRQRSPWRHWRSLATPKAGRQGLPQSEVRCRQS